MMTFAQIAFLSKMQVPDGVHHEQLRIVHAWTLAVYNRVQRCGIQNMGWHRQLL